MPQRYGRSAVSISSRANGAFGEHRRHDTGSRDASCWPTPKLGTTLRGCRMIPYIRSSEFEGLYHPLKNEGVLPYELLRRSARLEDRHVTKVCERTNPDDVTTREELVHDRLVSRKYFQDFFHAHAGRFSDKAHRFLNRRNRAAPSTAMNSRRFTRSPRRRWRAIAAVWIASTSARFPH